MSSIGFDGPQIGFLQPGGGGTPLAEDIVYTPKFAGTGNTSTNLKEQLEWNETHVGTADVVWSEPTLAVAAPLAGSTYPMTRPSLWTPPLFGAPISLTAGLDVTLTNPASIDGLSGTRTALLGDVAGPLVSGEVQARGIAIGNTNVGGSDIQAESLAGRTLNNENVFLVGGNAGVIENVVGGSAWEGLGIAAPFPGAVGLSLDGTLGNAFIGNSVVLPPGTLAYTGITLEPTATVTDVLVLSVIGFSSQVPGDVLLDLNTGATVPTGAIPTDVIGVSVDSVLRTGPGSLFSATGFNETDIEIFSANHLSGPSSRYLGDALYDVTQTPGAPDASLTHVGVAPAVDVVPSDNASGGGAGATLVTLALDPLSQRHTLLNPSPQVWSVRYDGAPGDLNGVVVWSAQVLKSGGAAATVQGFVQESVGGGLFVTIPQTGSAPIGLINNTPQVMTGQAPIVLNSNNQYRVVMSTTDIAIPTLIRRLTIESAGRP